MERNLLILSIFVGLTCFGFEDQNTSQSREGSPGNFKTHRISIADEHDSTLDGFINALFSKEKVILLVKTWELEDGLFRYSENADPAIENSEAKSEFSSVYWPTEVTVVEDFCYESGFMAMLFMRREMDFMNGYRPQIYNMGTTWMVVAEDAVSDQGLVKERFLPRLDGVEVFIELKKGRIFVLDEGPEKAIFFNLTWKPTKVFAETPPQYDKINKIELKDVRKIVNYFCKWEKSELDEVKIRDILILEEEMETGFGREIVSRILERVSR